MSHNKLIIAIIGLGMMGWPMAMNLAEAGYTVRAYDINPAALEMVREAGVQSAFGPEDVAGALKLIKGG